MSTTERPTTDRGTAYGRPPATYDAELTEVAPGTPCGEFMRRYWHPIALSDTVVATPQKARILGEDLILFRDRKGRPGLLYPRCAHRGTTLFFGKVEDDGIRCCYHGWLFGVDGRCLDQPCEPTGSTYKERVRQPWYAVEERYGLVWAYLGAPDKKPVLPRYSSLENVGDGEKLFVTGSAFGAGGDASQEIVPCNWLQDWENIMDPMHIPILHTSFSGVQFVPEMGIMPTVEYHHTDHGMRYIAYRKLDDGRELDRVTQALYPHVRIVPDVHLRPGPAPSVGFVLPVDDTHFRLFHIMRLAAEATFVEPRALRGMRWSEMSEAEHQATPGDWEAQVGQGPISFHSEEHLATSDRGVIMLRKQLREQIAVVRAGGDPLGLTFDEREAVYEVRAGNYYR